MHLPWLSVAFFGGLFVSTVWGGEVTVQSGPGRTNLLELFTSEGCSSCPPAEQRFSKLRTNTRLWKEIVPVAFHVDYWDRLGWKDALGSRAFTKRQYDYAATWRSESVYTPCFVLNGAEWRGEPDGIAATKIPAGKLVATMRDDGEVLVTYTPLQGGEWAAHAALLGLGLSTEVKAGENSGRKLVHDFAVLNQVSEAMAKATDGVQVTLHLPAEKAVHGRTALAVWVTEAGQLIPKQAAGGPL